MLKKVLSVIAITATLSLFAINANALGVNITLGNDIVSNKDKLNVSYDIYYHGGSVSQQIKGTTQKVFALWLQAFNRENKDIVPVDFQGKHSQISLGYRKNEQDVYPASCQNMRLTNVDRLNIILTENGCAVN